MSAEKKMITGSTLNAKIKYRAFEGYFPETVEPELVVSGKKV